jgi:RHS repeat-associated protein
MGVPSSRSGCDATCGSPINLTTGNTWIQQQDYSLPGLGVGLNATRTWNSLWALNAPVAEVGMFGDSWRSTYEESLQAGQNNQLMYWRGDGSAWTFTYNSSNQTYSLTSPPDERATLVFNSATNLFTLTLLNGNQEIFNNNGVLTALKDRNGNQTNLTYDTSHRLVQVADPASRALTFNYANSTLPGQVTSIQDATGTIATYSYDSASHLTTVTYADNSVINYAYDSNGLITSATDAQGKVLEAHTYNSSRQGLTSSRADGLDSVSISYASGTATLLDSLGNSTTYAALGISGRNFISSIAGSGCDTCGGRGNYSHTYDGSGNRTSSTDPLGHLTNFFYDSNGNVTLKAIATDSSGNDFQRWSYTYNAFGEVLTATDPLNNVTTNTYDSKGNLLTTTTPSPGGRTAASVTTFAYDTKGELTSTTDPNSHKTTIAYNSVGLISSLTDAQSKVTQFQYDARGNRNLVIDANNQQTSFTYDVMNRLTKITYPTTPSSSTQFGYDYRGRKASVTDQNGKITQYAYDDADRLISVTDANNGLTQYAYDTESNLTSIRDAGGNLTTFQYDAFGHVTQATFPSNLFETYSYDLDENLLSKTDRNGHAINYTYDYLNRLSQKSYPDSTAVNYTYDLANRLTQVADPTGTYGSTYDNMNRLTQTSTAYSFISGKTFTVGYGYDAASNRTSMTDPQNAATAYVYDTLNRLTTLTYPSHTNFTFSYDALGRRTKLVRPNGVTTNYQYDTISDLLSALHQVSGKSGTTTLDGATYQYDVAGNRTSKTDNRTNITSSFSYDPTYQLTQVVQGSTTKETYSFDLVGNRLSSLGVSPYAYNGSNELTSKPGATYTYDNNGNMLTKTDSTGTTTYTWNFENRLASVALPGSGGTVTFRYDPFGRRAQKSSLLGTTNYLYDGVDSLEEVDTTGNVLARYTRGPGVDQPLAEVRSGTTSYYEADGLGSVTSLSNSSGALANTYTYDSFGNLTASTGTLTNPLRYTAREFDSETGLYFYRARYYDSSTGRFLKEDPLRFQAGANFYAYVGNSPLNALDPSGMLVTATYNKSSGQLTVTDSDTGQTVTAGVESGGKPFGDPIPNGTYDILEQQRKPDEFRLDKEDSTPYDDIDDATGRSHFRLHHPGRTIGCIAAKDWTGWNGVFNIISNTRTTMVPDNFRPWWKFWPSQPSYLRDFGTLVVQ